MTLKEVAQKIKQAGSSTPDLDARLLLEMVTARSPAQILAGDWTLSTSQVQQLKKLIAARRQNPIAYLRGEIEFWGLQFQVDRRVLIPRPESEDLVELGLKKLPPCQTVYDVGCGSGCLGLAYALNQNQPISLVLIDNSKKALAVARQNASQLQVEAQFWLQSVADIQPRAWEPNSLVIANLPYLDHDQKQDYYQRCPDLAAEPESALFATKKGLAIYNQLWPKLGSKPRYLILEADYHQRAKLIVDGQRHHWRLIGHQGLALAFERSDKN